MDEISEPNSNVAGSQIKKSDQNSQRNCLLVLGMHRSGTSALTRVLSLMGAELPKTVLGARTGNEVGHWEPERLMLVHEQLLAEAGSSWDDWRKLDLAATLPFERRAYYKKLLRQTIEDEYGTAPLFVIKEPRICRFVPLYCEVLSGMGVAVRPILTFRNPLEVAESLATRDGFSLSQGLLYYLRHVLDSERDSRNMLRAVTSYSSLLSDWRSEIASIEGQLGLTWPNDLANVAAEIDGFLSPTYRHHAVDEAALATTPNISTWVHRVVAAASALREDPNFALKEFDDVGRDFDAASEFFGASLSAERRNRDQMLQAQKDAAATALASVQAECREHSLEAERARQETLNQQHRHEEALAAANAVVEAERQQAEAARQQLTRSLAEAEQRLDAEAREHSQALGTMQSERDQAIELAARLSAELEADRVANRAAVAEQVAAREVEILKHAAHVEHLRSAYESSSSWRITSPIRVTKNIARASLRSIIRIPRAALNGARQGTAARRILSSPSVYKEIQESSLFDPAYYRQSYPDVASKKIDPLTHYVKFGAAEGRNPSREFDTAFYLSTYPDVARSRVNPLFHYLRFGKLEGRAIAPTKGEIAGGSQGSIVSTPSQGTSQDLPLYDTEIVKRAYSINLTVSEYDGRPRVLILPAIFAVGGVERNVASVMRMLASSFRFVVVTNEPHSKESGCLLHAIRDVSEAIFDLASLSDRADHIDLLQSIIGAFPPDLVWVCNGSVWFHQNIAQLQEMLADIPIVDQQVYDHQHGWINHLTPGYIQSVDRFIASNEKIHQRFIELGVKPENIDRIYHAIDTAPLKISSREVGKKRRYAFIGRMTEQKAPLDFIEVARLVGPLKPDVSFVMVGGGPLEKECARAVERQKLSNVELAPFTDKLHEFYHTIDAVVFVSAYEGLPLVMLEALASGVPVIATDVGEIAGVAATLPGGCVVVPDAVNCPTKMATALMAFDDSLSHHTQLARNAASVVRERFGAPFIAQSYFNSWASVWQEQVNEVSH